MNMRTNTAQKNEFCLQGAGYSNDAIFTRDGDKMRIVAIRGWTGCWDETVSIEKAREMWHQLRNEGWTQVEKPRRPAHAIRFEIYN